MSVLDSLIAGPDMYQSDMAYPDGPPMTAPMPGAAPSQAQPGANVMELLARAMTPQEPTPPTQPNMRGIPAMALLRFAAQATRPKAYGQSTGNALLEAGSSSLQYADHMKRQAVAAAQQEDALKARRAESEARLRNEQLGSVSKAQTIMQTEKAAPLELEALKQKLENAKDERTLNALKIKTQAVAVKYADEMEQAKIREKNARTDTERAQAAAQYAHAALFKKQAEELVNIANIRAKGGAADSKVQWVRNESITGGRPTEYNKITNETRPAKFSDTQSAMAWAKAEIEAQKEAGLLPAGVDETALLAKMVRENVMGGEPNRASGTVTPAAAGKPGELSDAEALTQGKAMSAASKSGKKVTLKDGSVHYFYNGKEISPAEFTARQPKG